MAVNYCHQMELRIISKNWVQKTNSTALKRSELKENFVYAIFTFKSLVFILIYNFSW